MRKIYKVKPSVPDREFVHYDMFDYNCYGCKDTHGCNNCPRAKEFNHKERRKRIKKERNQKEWW